MAIIKAKPGPKKKATKKTPVKITSINQIVKEESLLSVNWSRVPSGTKVKGSFGKVKFEGRFVKRSTASSAGLYGHICSNTLDGTNAPNKLGYKYSHTISRENEDRFRITELTLDPKFKMPEVFIINGHAVQFGKGSIKIGCTTVSNTVVKKIAAQLV